MKHVNFNKLTSISDADIDGYKSMLDFAFKEKDLNNIAITGSYGSGKSSLINSYLHSESIQEVLFISLANFSSSQAETSNHFDGEISDSNGKQINVVDNEQESYGNERMIEGKIINQLIHKINVGTASKSSFKPIRYLDGPRVVLTGLSITWVILSLLSLVFFNRIVNFLIFFSSKFTNLALKGIIKLGLLLSFVFALILLIRNIVQIMYQKNIIKKLSFQGNEIEILSKEEDSYFDKYLDEILYLISESNVKYIIFEDLDRFDTNNIFVRLREINNLLNHNKEFAHEKKSRAISWFVSKYSGYITPQSENVKFLYLLKDNTFTTSDRTKFFDFIIPIIPVLDPHNARDELIKQLKRVGEGNLPNEEDSYEIYDDFSRIFLRDISYYISDKRLLNNIINEYQLYNYKLEKLNPNKEKLLSMIIYKNTFPKDFHDLQLGKGFVKCLFEDHQKNKFTTKAISRIKNKIKAIEVKIENAEKEQLLNEDELIAIYLFNKSIIRINNIPVSNFKNATEAVSAMREDNSTVIYYNNYHQRQEKTGNEILLEVYENESYQKQKDNINNKNIIDKLQLEISEFNDKLLTVKSFTLKEAIELVGRGEIFDNLAKSNPLGKEELFEDVKLNDNYQLIIYLICEGYIDERTYRDYMSHFYEDSLTSNDHQFVNSIINIKALPYNYKIDSTKNVLIELDERDYKKLPILNYFIVKELLETSDHSRSLEGVLNVIRENKSLTFINEFLQEFTISDENIDVNNPILKFIRLLNESWSNIWYEIDLFNGAFNCQYYAILTIISATDYKLAEYNSEGHISRFLEKDTGLLKQEKYVAPVNEAITKLGIKFNLVEKVKMNSKILVHVYKGNHYHMNLDNVLKMFVNYYENSNFNYNLYTVIQRKESSPLSIYINKEIVKFFNFYVEKSVIFLDDEYMVIKLVSLFCDAVSDNQIIPEVELNKVQKYFTKWEGKFNNINNLKTYKDIYKLSIKTKSILESESNIIGYYLLNEETFDSNIATFINESVYRYDFSVDVIKHNLTEEQQEKFIVNLINCEELEADIHLKILSSIDYKLKDITLITSLRTENINMLITNRVIEATTLNLLELRKRNDTELKKFITININEYIDFMITEEYDEDELLSILEFDVPVSSKLKILDKIDSNISIVSKKYEEELIYTILKHNYFPDDFETLVNIYSSFESEDIKQIIYEKLVQKIEELLGMNIDEELLKRLYQSNALNSDEKLELFSNNIPPTRQQTAECLLLINSTSSLSFYELLTKEGQSNKAFYNSELNVSILNDFIELSYISSYREDTKNSKMLRANWKKEVL